MRLFIGIGLPEAIRSRLASLSRSLAPSAPHARWVDEPNLHLTLKFLGETAEESIDRLVDAMRTAAGCVGPFSMRLDRLGMFPSARRARVVWLGVSDGARETTSLAKSLDLELAPLGYRSEARPFHPHITLARLRVPEPLTGLAEDASEQPPPVDASVSVTHVTLFESRLRRTGAQYFVVEEVPLGSD
ncbi:MAG: RNA 2',3'-cyclic phosphodiesterase [Actinobacteria bacterium]|nr:MAG: RNA 2',3'-cyclic phosphodiesterase [Actinomycetota bacterium]